MIKDIFILIDDIIRTEVPEVRWVDFDLGQMDMEAPPVSWPCVLIGFSDTEFSDLLTDTQVGLVTVELRVAFNLKERTHSLADTAWRDIALSHLDTLHKIHMAMQGASAPCITEVTRVGFTTEPRADYRVYVMRYRVTAYEGPMTEDEKDYKNWKLYDTKPETVDPDFEVILEPEE